MSKMSYMYLGELYKIRNHRSIFFTYKTIIASIYWLFSRLKPTREADGSYLLDDNAQLIKVRNY